MDAPPSDASLVRYLLGNAGSDDEERFDELSVTDAAFAERLRALEHDLADAYVRGELPAADRERWEARYLASQHGRDDLAIAEALADRDRLKGGSGGRVFTPSAWWPLAAAAVLVLAIGGGYRMLHRAQAPATIARQSPVVTPAPPPAPARRVVALSLTPSVRSLDAPPTLTIPAGTTDVTLTLTLEPDDAPRYDVAVRDLSTNDVAWRADGVAAAGTDQDRAIVVSVPASTFHTRRYLISVMRSGAKEILASYPLVAVVQ